MREQALRARPRRRGLPRDRGERRAVADNVLDRQFRADAPNQKWVAYFTCVAAETTSKFEQRTTRGLCVSVFDENSWIRCCWRFCAS